MDFARLWGGLLLPLVATLDFGYHHQEEMEAFLKTVAQNYSAITHLHSIGKSVKGRGRLRSRRPRSHSLQTPERRVRSPGACPDGLPAGTVAGFPGVYGFCALGVLFCQGNRRKT